MCYNGYGVEEVENKIISFLLECLSPMLQPVQVNYSNEVLAQQIHGISVMLLLLSLFIMMLVLGLLVNILLIIHSEKILNNSKNKYIRRNKGLIKKSENSLGQARDEVLF